LREGAAQRLVLDQAIREQQGPREGVHAADVRVEEVHGVEGAAAHLGVEVQAAVGQAALIQDDQHGP
jgi:hypothetical protein